MKIKKNDFIKFVSMEYNIPVKCVQKNIDTNLFLEPYNFIPEELLYLLFRIEEYFNIKIDEKYLSNYKFSTINNIYEIIATIINDI